MDYQWYVGGIEMPPRTRECPATETCCNNTSLKLKNCFDSNQNFILENKMEFFNWDVFLFVWDNWTIRTDYPYDCPTDCGHAEEVQTREVNTFVSVFVTFWLIYAWVT